MRHFSLSAIGRDRPGIVAALTEALLAHDLNTRLVVDGDSDLYAMMLEVALPQGLGADEVTSLLEAARREQDVEVTVRELEQDEL
ncbi:MAG TPA: hypothetical protein VIM22_00875 [Solirubrobacteraceae bacterium]